MYNLPPKQLVHQLLTMNDHGETAETYELTSTSHSKAYRPPEPKSCFPQRPSRTCIGWTVGVLVVTLVVVTIVIVQTTAANRYPNYSRLDYRLVDVYRGENFFDKFDYFTG